MPSIFCGVWSFDYQKTDVLRLFCLLANFDKLFIRTLGGSGMAWDLTSVSDCNFVSQSHGPPSRLMVCDFRKRRGVVIGCERPYKQRSLVAVVCGLLLVCRQVGSNPAERRSQVDVVVTVIWVSSTPAL
jgi:hypothetical protein